MLSHKAPKEKGRTITVRPFPDVESSFASSSSYLSHSVQPSGLFPLPSLSHSCCF